MLSRTPVIGVSALVVVFPRWLMFQESDLVEELPPLCPSGLNLAVAPGELSTSSQEGLGSRLQLRDAPP
ncbi:hypothetical protein HNQ08_003674 [Deinococcus humi]|uniref:Uncharacterized protein n=1 Tax=Deinococcus humi TaxID=662880 RepID=A0A7W8NFL3_9DEIO|nr:hypothetical protein [Deinococcus humi]GGO38183.1 hypothetical protein GCM10008949_44390 [Deinococcus humi]